ncbi:MAG: hypothetical protein U0230_00840 [Polyangiales bacterium]
MRQNHRAWGAAALAVAIAGCGSSAMKIEPRYVAVQNAMSGVGFAQVGPISEASLDRGGEIRIPIELAAGECRTFVALGERSIDDLDVVVRDPQGNDLAHDEGIGRNATATVCDPEGGAFDVVVRARDGHGGVIVSSFAGGGGGGSARGGGRGGAMAAVGTCAGPQTLVPGQSVQGDTSLGERRIQGSCIRGNAPEVTYRLVLEQAAQVLIEVESSFDAGVYVLRTCGNAGSEVACNDDAGDTAHSRVNTTLDAGTYFVVVDGYNEAQGTFDLRVTTTPLVPLAQLCSEAPILAPGTEITGSTTTEADRFQATCAGGARSPDRVQRLQLTERSRVRIHQRSEFDGALHVRRACEDAASEVACNDDWNGTNDSIVTSVLDPGTYFVVTDGFGSAGQSNAGNYSLRAEVAPAAGGGAPGDACAAPTEATLGQAADVDTFRASDDLAGSCGGRGAPDVVQHIRLAARSRVEVTVRHAQFNGVVYVRRGCADGSAEVACQAFDIATNAQAEGRVSADLDAGDYFVVVDGTDGSSFGSANVEIRTTDLVAVQRSCDRAPMLRAGRTVNGTTAGAPNQFQASCAGSAESGDAVYRIRLTRRSYVTLELSTTNHDGALHLRRECSSQSSELACNDDEGDNRHSRIGMNLEAGTYYVVVDGFSNGNAGDYSLRYEVGEPRSEPPPPQPSREAPHPEGREYKAIAPTRERR